VPARRATGIDPIAALRAGRSLGCRQLAALWKSLHCRQRPGRKFFLERPIGEVFSDDRVVVVSASNVWLLAAPKDPATVSGLWFDARALNRVVEELLCRAFPAWPVAAR
jgi:hypothetical protein